MSTTWAIIVVLVLPLGIIAASELDERLRQRESEFRGAVLILRNWALPFFAIWALLTPVLGVDQESLPVRLAASGMLVAITIATLSVLRVIVDRVRQRARAGQRRSAPELLLALPRIAVFIVAGWILIDSIWNIDLSAALTALGVTSLVISFALQDTLSGLASGVLLLSDQPFKPGDWIRVGESEGMVVDINWRTSRIRTRNGDMMIVPNSELAGSAIVNFSAPENVHRVVVTVQVAYKNPPTLAKAMLLDAARGTPGVRLDPPPAVRVVTIDDPLMTYEVDMWIDDYRDEPRSKSDFGSLVWYQSHRHGVPLPSPAQDLYLYDGVAAGIEELPTAGELREGLSLSPLLASLPDEDLDRLAHATTGERFAVGELLIAPDADQLGPSVIIEGRAHIVALDGETEVTISELGPGDVTGILESAARSGLKLPVMIRAVSDCEVLTVDRNVFGEVGSRNSELAAAINRSSAIRRRRLERVVEARRGAQPEPETETETETETDS
ncbi:MAG: mechanosensitive ion channel domain-containing protein [Acidimicrobiales bacterium]